MQKMAAQGASLSELSVRFSLSESSLQRHFAAHVPRDKGAKGSLRGPNNAVPAKKARSVRFASSAENGRCRECDGLLTEIAEDGKIDGKSLVWRAERLLHTAETIALQAKDAGDARLCLASVDRAQRSLDSLLKVAGLIGADVQVNIDQRSVNVFQDWKTEDVAALDAFTKVLVAKGTVEQAIEAVVALQKPVPALPDGTDQTALSGDTKNE